jgi:hypothetical protein
VHSVLDVQLTEVAFAVPNLNVVLPTRKFRPFTVTLVLPAGGPVFGVTLLTVGGGVNVNLSAPTATLWPAALVSVMSTTPGDDAGDTAFSDVAEVTVNFTVGVFPNFTAVTSGALKLMPVIVTDVPPVSGPVTVDSLLTAGGVTYFRGRLRAGFVYSSHLQAVVQSIIVSTVQSPPPPGAVVEL